MTSIIRIGIICSNEPVYQDVTLTASTPSGWSFGGWGGGCSGTATTCTLTMDAHKSVSTSWNDVQDPTVSLTSPNSSWVSGTIPLSANASDNDSVSKVEFYVDYQKVGEDTTAPYSMSFDTVGRDGLRQFGAVATDRSGRTAHSGWWAVTVDNTRPVLNVTGGPNGQTFGPGTTQRWTFSAEDNHSGIASVQCSVVPTGSPASYGACSGGNTSHSVFNKPEGSYTFTVRARDYAGLETTQSRTFSIDATQPDTRIDSASPGGQFSITRETSATFTFSAVDDATATFECRVYVYSSLNDTTPDPFGACSGEGTHTVNNLATEGYVFEVRARDTAGNVDQSPAQYIWGVDTIAPETTIPSGPSGTVKTNLATFTFSSEDGATFECKLDASAFEPCASTKSYTGLANGSHTFQVRAADRAGNVENPAASRTWTVDAIKPTISGMSPRHASITRDTTPTIRATVRDNTPLAKANIKLYVAGRLISPTKYSYAPSTGALLYNSPRLAKGKKTVRIVVTDAARNVGAKSWYFTIR